MTASENENTTETRAMTERGWLALLIGYMLILIAWGVMHDPASIPAGLLRIGQSPGILVSDYVVIGGVGAAFVNAGLVGLMGLLLAYATGATMSGPTIAATFTIAGFGFFGKNWWSIWPVILGVYLFSRVTRNPFKGYILVALYGTALSPVVTQITYGLNWGLLPGIAFGIVVGFLLPPIAVYMLRLHQGFNIYNVGLSCGFLGLFVTALLTSSGAEIASQFHWAEQYNTSLGAFLGVYAATFLVIGLILTRGVDALRELIREAGTLPTDFVDLYGAGPVLINMGLVGLIGWGYILLVGGTFNGPTLGGVFTMIGFAAFGKHVANISPVMAGVYLGSQLLTWAPSEPGPLLAALFATTLAPISGQFGVVLGFIAGVIHLTLVMRTGAWHAGLNLYNNGFAGGLTATLLVSLINWWTSWREEQSERKA
jgi:hypothetical protein